MLFDKREVLADNGKVNVLVVSLSPADLKDAILKSVKAKLETQENYMTDIANLFESSQIDVQVLNVDTNTVAPLEMRLGQAIFATVPDSTFEQLDLT